MRLSSFGVLVQLFYFVVDYEFAEPIRSQIKRFVDKNFAVRGSCVSDILFSVSA